MRKEEKTLRLTMLSVVSTLRRASMLAFGLSLGLTGVAADNASCPTGVDPLPSNTHRISHFGERPAFSPDGSKVAFMAKSYGDAFELDLETNVLTLLTHYTHSGYLRVQYLPNGDLFLIGSRTYVDDATTRDTTMEMWILHPGDTAPTALDHKIWEGVAISLHQNKIAWANVHDNYPDGDIMMGQSVIYTGDIVYNNGTPSLANEREVLRAYSSDCILEPQDFFKNDTHLTYSCYTPDRGSKSNVRGIDLATGEITIYRDVPDEYNEVEGIYPDGEYTLVESSKYSEDPTTTNGIDLWRLKLEPNSTDFVRLTCWNVNPGNKTGNPVVSPDGRTMAFQSSHAGDQAGVGYGIYLLDLE